MASRLVNVPDYSCKARVNPTRALRFSSNLRRAFTLIELSCVILVMGIVAAIAIPKYADSNTLYRVEIAAKRVQADIQMAQDLARTLSLSHQAVFKPGSCAYVIEPSSSDPTPMEIASSGARITDLSQSPFGVRVMKAKFGAGSTLTIDAFGAPLNAGHLVLYANDWGALLRVGAGLGRVDITMFRLSSPPFSVTTEVGPMDIITRTLAPVATADLEERFVSVKPGITITAVDVLSPDAGIEAPVDRTTAIDKP